MTNINVLQTIAGFGAKSGGTSTCTYDLLRAIHEQKSEVDLLTPTISVSSDCLMGNGEKWIKVLPYDYHTPYGISRNMKKFLEASNYDIYHTNGLWMYINHITCNVARAKNKPYLITPHGMLYPLALRRSYWKKWPLIQCCFRRDIQDASCIHVTCCQEMEYVRQFGYQGPIAVIANPVVIPEFADILFEKKKQLFLGCNLPKKLGFMGRLHPIKKIENLLYGASALQTETPYELVIIGKGDDEYEQFLCKEVKRLKLNNVQFAGFVSGREKYELLAQLSCLFVPSDFENFGMIVTEALSVGTPVMASLGTPWEELNTWHCGWWMDRTPENIASVMNTVLELPASELVAMGERGQHLVLKNYAANIVAGQMLQLYEWIVNGGIKPEFIYES